MCKQTKNPTPSRIYTRNKKHTPIGYSSQKNKQGKEATKIQPGDNTFCLYQKEDNEEIQSLGNLHTNRRCSEPNYFLHKHGETLVNRASSRHIKKYYKKQHQIRANKSKFRIYASKSRTLQKYRGPNRSHIGH